MVVRRNWLKAALSLFVSGAAVSSSCVSNNIFGQQPDDAAQPKKRSGKIRQSVMGWCFNPMDPVDWLRPVNAWG
ncbi:MAG: hypothetical protein U0930_00535 [Pirellulales bacterium]